MSDISIILVVVGVFILLNIFFVKKSKKNSSLKLKIKEIDILLLSINNKSIQELYNIEFTEFLPTNTKYKKILEELKEEKYVDMKYPKDLWLYIESKTLKYKENIKINNNKNKGINYIKSMKISFTVISNFLKINPNLNQSTLHLIDQAFKEYIILYIENDGKVLSPSRVIEDLWKTYELSENIYANFSEKSFGKYVPAQVRSTSKLENTAMVDKTFKAIKKSNNLNNSYLLFQIDEISNIDNPYDYKYFLELI